MNAIDGCCPGQTKDEETEEIYGEDNSQEEALKVPYGSVES
jgi:hypothetical protein